MKAILHRTGVGLLLLLLNGACGKFDTAEIDQQYLESESFVKFQQQVTFEQHRTAYNNEPIGSYLEDFENCKSVPVLSLPLRLDSESIGRFVSSEHNCVVEKDMMSIKLLAQTHAPHHHIRWVLLDYKTTYRDQRLVLSAFRDGQLRSFTTVGIYKKNLTTNIRSLILARETENGMYISTQTKRNIQYPIEQKNVVRTNYNIDGQGSITKL